MAEEHILVVDDDPGLLTLMQTRLEAAGYGATLVETGEEALAWAQEHAYDLAIIDLKMADVDGLTLLQELLRLHPHLPVIILTAHGTISSAVEATKLGAYDYLMKPFNSISLMTKPLRGLLIVPKPLSECCALPSPARPCEDALRSSNRGRIPTTRNGWRVP